MFERISTLARRCQSRDVRHVIEQQRTNRIGNEAHAPVVPVARVSGCASYNELGSEELGALRILRANKVSWSAKNDGDDGSHLF